MMWWDMMEYVLKGVEPLYAFVHFADQDKVPNISKVLMWFNMCIGEYESLLHDYPNDLEQYIRVIKARIGDIANSTFVNASPRRRGRGGGRQYHLAPRSNTSSIQSGSESSSSYAHGYPEYLAPDPSTIVHDVQWVYEWESLKFYSMLISE
jgi:hypothetical protein